MGFGMIDDVAEQLQPERGQCPLPEFARGLAGLDEAPLLGGDRTGIHAIGEMVNSTARNRIAFPDGPFHRGDPTVPGQ